MTKLIPVLVASCLCLAVAAPGRGDTLLVVRKSADAVDFVDPASGRQLASIAVGFTPHEVSVAPDGRLAVVSNYGTGERPGSSVSVIDLQQARELRRIDLAPHTRPHGVAWYAPDRVAVTTEGSAHVLVVDPLAGKIVAAWPTQQEVSHMVAVASTTTPARAFVANIRSGTTSVLDLSGTAPPRALPTGSGSEGIAVTPDGRHVWVTARQAGALVVIDAATVQEVARVLLSGIPIRVAFSRDGATVYVTCAGSSEVVAFDAASRREIARQRIELPLSPEAPKRPAATMAPGSALPVGVVVASDNRTVFVAATMADAVVQLDARTLAVVRRIEVAGEPDGLGVTQVGPRHQ